MNAGIDRVWPGATEELSDADLLASYEEGARHEGGGPWLRLNFVSSLDGAATHDGLSGGLGDAADRRVFDLLRRLADVVLVGAGTVRAEGYGAMVLDETAVAWRLDHGRAAQPAFALVSGSLDLDPASAVFTAAPVRPLVFTTASASAERRDALAPVADLVTVGERTVDTAALLAELAARGLDRVLCEGGPTLAGTFLAAGLVNELCLTLAARLEGGAGGRILNALAAVPQPLRLAQALRAGSTLLLRYLR